jgi:hypothetical protein
VVGSGYFTGEETKTTKTVKRTNKVKGNSNE